MRQLNGEQIALVVGGEGREGSAYEHVNKICDANGFPDSQSITVNFSQSGTLGAFGSGMTAGISYETDISCGSARMWRETHGKVVHN